MTHGIRNWFNVKNEFKQTRIKTEYPNRNRLAIIFIVGGILSIAATFLISFVSPRETTPAVVESVRDVYRLLEPYQTLVFVSIWLFVILIIVGFVFLWKSDSYIIEKE